MQVADGFGWNPDGDLEFQIKDNKAYWEDGDITDMSEGVFRWMPITNPSERYAEWSDKKRTAVRAEWEAKQKTRRQEQVAKQEASGDICLVELDGFETKIIAAALRHYNDCGQPTSNADVGTMIDVTASQGEFDILELAKRIELRGQAHE